MAGSKRGDSIANVNVVGHGNTIDQVVHVTKTELPPAAEVNIAREIEQIRAILSGLGGEHAGKVERALDDAAEEARKPRPDKDEVGKAVDRALDYAKKTGDLAEQAGRLAPHVSRVVGWLGQNWHKLLPLVGLVA